MKTQKTQPEWLDKSLFPFDSKWIELEGFHHHYVDEGAGPILLFVHGTPEWSFGFRDLIKGLRQDFRCIAIDHLGFGLSDKPKNGEYTCQAHARRLELFIRKMNLRDITLVVNDFGGGIGLHFAINHPHDVKRVVLFNTWMWSLEKDRHYSIPARIMNTALGRYLYLKHNFSVNVMMPSAYGDKRKLTREVHRHYKATVPDGSSRVALFAFAQEMMNANAWWQSLWERMDIIADKPFLIFWGMKDKAIPAYELEKWKGAVLHPHVITFEDAGHFVQEEKPDVMMNEIRKFMSA